VNDRKERWTDRWLFPVGLLALLGMALFVGFFVLDHYVTGGTPLVDEDPRTPWERYIHFEVDGVADGIAALSGIIAAVLGIVVTVVAIIVQLSAERYTGVAQMFLRDRTNISVMSFYVVACVAAVWLGMAAGNEFVPRATSIVILTAACLGVVIMLPYFAYVFRFLDPANIVERIRQEAVSSVKKAKHTDSPSQLAARQFPILFAMEELSDITSNSISGKDKIIASKAVDALKDLCLDYLSVKDALAPAWFEVHDTIRNNPDFVAMDPESLRDLEGRRTWVEWKVLRQYLGIYNEAQLLMKDINYLVAIDTRYIGEAAAKRDDAELISLVFRYMNSYLRASLNARDVRTAYNVLNQYRILVQSMIDTGHGEAALAGVRHLNYYGHVSYDLELTFVTETVAYDVSALCEYAHARGAPEEDRMLEMFLELDRPLPAGKEKALLGVRKAQIKLAAYYLAQGEQQKARLIAADMKDEPHERLFGIRTQLESVTSKDFWEIIDRGRNFEYMPAEQREKLATFFDWLGVSERPPPAPEA
jgi:hypothetical protein